MGNHALQSNPPNATISITTHSSDWLWAVFSMMTFADLAMMFFYVRRIREQRFFHSVAVIILTTAAIAYFSMASDLGSTPISTEFRDGGATRAIWYVRYIYWFISFPLLAILLLIPTGLSYSEIFTTLFMTLVMIVSLLVGSLVHSTFKWGYFVFSAAAYLYVVYHLLGPARAASGNFGKAAGTTFRRGAGLLASIWGLYYVCWGLSEGGNVISPTGEMVFYGILDLITNIVFVFSHVFAVSKIDYETWGFMRRGGDNGGHLVNEKTGRPSTAASEGGATTTTV